MSDSGDFGLHVRLGRRRNRHIRLTRAGVSLLTAASLLWVIGVPWGWQLGLSLLASLVGLAWPVTGSSAWAIGVIGEQGGLAYETALAMEAQPRDDFGLRSQVRARARTSVAGLEQPRLADWWLAALVLAVAILLLPALRLAPPWSSTAPEPPPAATAPATDTEEQAPEEEPVTEEPQAQPEIEEQLPPQVQPQSGTPDDPSSAAQGMGGASESEGQVLDRFLDNLRERPPESPGTAEIPGTPVPAELEEPTEPSEQDAEGTSPGEAQDDQDAGETDGQAGSDSEASSGAGEQEQETDSGGPEEQSEGGESAGDGMETGAPAAGTDDTGNQDGASLSQGEGDGDGAGGGEGVEILPGDLERPGEAGGAEELLEGQLTGNEVNLGGDIRLPGFSDVELPPDSSPASLGEAVERSLTEGTVPLEYQEVIRNYFR